MNKDERLAAALKDPSTKEGAFRELITLYKERLYWHIRKIVRNHEDSDDVLQNTFIKVFKNIQHFKETSKLYTWMYRIATNEAISFLRQQAKKQLVSVEELQYAAVENLSQDSLYTGDQIQLLLQQAIATLPQKQQLVFNMKYFDEMKYREMADILDTSVGALKASYFHAVKKIEKFLESH
ncbi:MAG: RNA polymerase sigma factor [Lutibacter sp.]|nr:RNA polymerase sigma factor [Lutibacter sp.]